MPNWQDWLPYLRYLPKWGWAILGMGIGLTIPFGGIAYLLFGKVRRPRLE